jgi:hypothetical protein
VDVFDTSTTTHHYKMPSRRLSSSIWCSRHPFLHLRCTLSIHSSHSRAHLNRTMSEQLPPLPPEAVYLQDPDLENLEKYRPTWFHPTSIGDIFKDGRYKVVHKLGLGGYSTIWLARDLHRRRYAALKLQKARASLRNKESAILQSLRGPAATPALDSSRLCWTSSRLLVPTGRICAWSASRMARTSRCPRTKLQTGCSR